MKRLQYSNNKTIERKVPPGSKIFVSVKDSVSPSDIIAETKQTAGFHIIDVAQMIKTVPAKAKNYILRKEGDRIYKGELIAQRSQILSKEILRAYATADGTIQSINSQNGQVLIKIIRKQTAIPAGVWGTVESIENDQKVVISTQVLEIKGKAGRGFIREGTVKVIAQPTEVIREAMLQEEHTGKILVGGSLLSREAMTRAVNIGVVGFVSGSINYEDLTTIGFESDIGFSIVSCEGFGTVSLHEDIYAELLKLDGLYCFIDGKNTTLTVPLANKLNPASAISEDMPLGIGSRVRVLFEDNLGIIGTVTEVIPKYKFKSNLESKAIKMTHLNKDYIIPECNIEILE